MRVSALIEQNPGRILSLDVWLDHWIYSVIHVLRPQVHLIDIDSRQRVCRVDNVLHLCRANLLLLILMEQLEANILLWELLLLAEDIVISFQTANPAVPKLSKIFPVHS